MKKFYNEPVNIGLGASNHAFLKYLAEDEKLFKEMKDGYRFAMAYSIAKKIHPKDSAEKFRTTFSLASIDPDGSLKSLIESLYPDIDIPRYTILERLADAGMAELSRLHKESNLDIDRLLEEV
jgi:hypothetical protein